MSSFCAAVWFWGNTKSHFPENNICGDNNHMSLVKSTDREYSENDYPSAVQCLTSTCAKSTLESCNSKEVQPMHQTRCIVQASDD